MKRLTLLLILLLALASPASAQFGPAPGGGGMTESQLKVFLKDTSTITWTTGEVGAIYGSVAAITKAMVEAVLTGEIGSHLHFNQFKETASITWNTSEVGAGYPTVKNLRMDSATPFYQFFGFESGLGFLGLAATDNTFYGYQSGKGGTVTTAAVSNTAVGSKALTAITTGNHNTAVGAGAAPVNAAGVQNTFIGSRTGEKTTAGKNTGVGYFAGSRVTTGIDNTFVGNNSGSAWPTTTDCTGSYNTFVGSETGVTVTSGASNTVVGYLAGDAITTGSNNTFLGGGTGGAVNTGSNNIIIGYNSGGGVTSGNRNILLGYSAGWDITTGSGYFIIDPQGWPVASATGALIYGLSNATATLQTIVFNAKGTFSNDLNVEGTFKAGDKLANNYTTVGNNGVWMYGNATQWDDFMVGGFALKSTGASAPPFEAVGGTSTLFGHVFEGDSSSTQEVFCTIEMLHGWKEGSDATIHLHWAPSTTATDNCLIYVDAYWQQGGSALPAVTQTVTAVNGGGTAWGLETDDLVVLPGAGKTIGSQIHLRISRKATQTGDDGPDIWLESVGAHVEMNSIGSSTISTK